MATFEEKMKTFFEEKAEHERILALNPVELDRYLYEHPDFRSSDAQLHSDLELRHMKMLDQTLGEGKGLEWAHKLYWERQGAEWQKEKQARMEPRLHAFWYTIFLNAARYSLLLVAAFLFSPQSFIFETLPVFLAGLFGLALFAAIIRKVI